MLIMPSDSDGSAAQQVQRQMEQARQAACSIPCERDERGVLRWLPASPSRATEETRLAAEVRRRTEKRGDELP